MDHLRQIVTRLLSEDELWSELRNVLSRLRGAGMQEMDMMFGFAWGNCIAPESGGWSSVRVPVDEIEDRIRKQDEEGCLGADDLILSHPDLPFEFQFCHEADIHIWLGQRTPLVDDLVTDWKAKGLVPRDLLRQGSGWDTTWVDYREGTDSRDS